MINKSLSVHQTTATKLENEHSSGWEFTCSECSYRARYLHRHDFDEHTFEILNSGDPGARHTNTPIDEPSPANWYDTGNNLDQEVDESWLTPEIRKKLEEIASALDD